MKQLEHQNIELQQQYHAGLEVPDPPRIKKAIKLLKK